MSWPDRLCRLGRRIGPGLSWRRRHLLWRLTVRWALVRTALRWAARRPGRPHGLTAPLVVSLTSYPPRFPTLALTLRCLLTQDLRPDRVVLWVAHADLALLPPAVLALRGAGLTIAATEDLRSYKKIIPALEAFPDAVIVTADDDLYYPGDWLRQLVTGWEGRPDRIVCRRAHLVGRDGDGGLRPYRAWGFETARDGDSTEIFPTGVGGVLYPPGSLHPEVRDRAVFLDLCPQADDVWLYWMGRRNGMRYRRVGDRAGLVFWDGTQEVALWNDNLAQDANDRQIARMVARYGLPGAVPAARGEDHGPR